MAQTAEQEMFQTVEQIRALMEIAKSQARELGYQGLYYDNPQNGDHVLERYFEYQSKYSRLLAIQSCYLQPCSQRILIKEN